MSTWAKYHGRLVLCLTWELSMEKSDNAFQEFVHPLSLTFKYTVVNIGDRRRQIVHAEFP